MQERVLVVKKATLSDVPIPVLSNRNGSAELWLGVNIGSAHYLDRSLAEDSTWAVQIIPYVVLKCRDRYCTYTRGNKGTEGRLHGLLSVGLGGHVNPGDGEPGLGCLEAAMERELSEEVIINTKRFTRQLKGLLWDPRTPVGAVHVGVVTVFQLVTADVVTRENGKIVGLAFYTRAELVKRLDQLEPWSKAVVEGLL